LPGMVEDIGEGGGMMLLLLLLLLLLLGLAITRSAYGSGSLLPSLLLIAACSWK
jgi:hypothetical protein